MSVQSSGSTGRPVRALFPLEQRAWGDAVERRAAGWLGIEPGDRRVHVSAARALTRPRARLNAALLNRELVPARVLEDAQRAEQIVRRLERRRTESIEGVSNGLYALALVAREHGAAIHPRVCWSGGNHLTDHYRSTIESVFGCSIHERYSAWEAGMIAHQCPEERAWHVVAETIVAEIVRSDGARAAPGELGELVITCLRNRAMPLIRYRIGDLAVAGDGRRCRCGRSLPLLGELVGRSNDLIRRRDGGSVVPTAVSRVMAEAGDSIVEFSVHQTVDGRLRAQVVQRGDGLERAREAVRTGLDDLLGTPGVTVVDRVDNLPAGPGGKLRHISSAAGPG